MRQSPATCSSEVAAWRSYWRDSGSGSCVPKSAELQALLRSCWTEFAETLPHNAHVVDLGTGMGAVLDDLAAARPDLQLTGIDSVDCLPPRDGRSIQTGVQMESLPFGDDQIDAISSQFAFEYADGMRVTAEIVRVLRPGGALQLVIHHRDGVIIEDSANRSRALEWAVRDSDPFNLIVSAASLNSAAAITAPMSQLATKAGQLFPREAVASEIVAAVAQVAKRTRREWLAQLREELQELRARALNEMQTLAALDRAAQNSAGIERICNLFKKEGITVDRPLLLRGPPSQRPFGWLVRGQKFQ